MRMSFNLPLSVPVFDGNEKKYSSQAIEAGLLATYGEFIGKFEEKLSRKVKSHQSVALNSGTSALHLSLVLLGVESGDEVICQSFTFCASANPIVYLGATPIFVDSEKDSWNICPEILEDTILSRIANGKKPKAIVVVHLFGMPARMKEILEISQKYEIPIIEDASESVGSRINDQFCGTFGDIGIFSFNGNKIITTGGGGALISRDTQMLQRARYLSAQAREDLPYYQHLEIGYNYRMNNMAAAIGLAQLEQLDSFVEKRRKINRIYRILLADVDVITFQNERGSSYSNFWLSSILIDPKKSGTTNDKLRVRLLKEDIETRFLWKPLHLQPVFQNMPYFGGTISEELFYNGLCLPSSVSLTLEDQERIVNLIKSTLVKTVY